MDGKCGATVAGERSEHATGVRCLTVHWIGALGVKMPEISCLWKYERLTSECCDLLFEQYTETIFFHFQIVPNLKVEPESFAEAKETCEPQRSVRGDRAFSMNDFVNSPRRNTNVLCKPVLADAERFEKLLQEDFPWVNWCHFF